jgi:hypothetical protein
MTWTILASVGICIAAEMADARWVVLSVLAIAAIGGAVRGLRGGK